MLAKFATESLKSSEKIVVSNFYRDLLNSAKHSSSSSSSTPTDDSLTSEETDLWTDWINSAISFGPKKVGCNVLINKIPGYEDRPSVWPGWVKNERTFDGVSSDDDDDDEKDADNCVRENDHSIISGFQLATNCGPICNEPLMGVAVVLLDWKLGLKNVDSTGRSEDNSSDRLNGTENRVTSAAAFTVVVASAAAFPAAAAISHGPMSGQLMSAMKEGILKSFSEQPRRLMVAMYSCEIQVYTYGGEVVR